MANFKSPNLDDRGRVPCGVHLEKGIYKEIVKWCESRNIAIDSFIRVATIHFYFSLTAVDEETAKKNVLKFQVYDGHRHEWGGR